jgi:hypothetical protein
MAKTNAKIKKRDRRWAHDPTNGKMVCYTDVNTTQRFAMFAEAAKLSDFHDESLAKATKELNSIIKNIPKNKKDPNYELAFLETSEGYFLAWTDNRTVSSEDDEDVIEEALGLR